MNAVDKKFVEDIKNRLIEVYQPLFIYLFGSYAWGNPDESSDLDLFIVIEKSDLSMADRIRKGLIVLSNVEKPLDLLVFTMEEFESRQKHPSTLTSKIVKDGLKIYEAA
jgi:uncharacterized protein